MMCQLIDGRNRESRTEPRIVLLVEDTTSDSFSFG